MSKTVMQLYSGRPFDLLNPKADDVCILDVAESLSKINRYNGHTLTPVSVAQHSVIVSMLLDGTGFEIDGLMHDAHEAFIGDITSPVKAALNRLYGKDIVGMFEWPIRRAVVEQFQLRDPMPFEVKDADMRALQLERHYFMNPPTIGVRWDSWNLPDVKDCNISLSALSAAQAANAFIGRYKELMARVPAGKVMQ